MKTKFISIAATLLLAASFNTAFAGTPAPRYYLVGEFNEWNNNTMLPFEENDGVYTLTPTTKISGEFKIFEEGRTNLLGANVNGQFWLTKDNSEVELYEAQNAAALFFQFEEIYTFTIKDNKLSVNLDDLLIAGSFNYWAPQRMTAETDGTYTFEVNGNDQFKILDFNNKWYGGDSPNWDTDPHEIKDVWHTNINMISGGANFKINDSGTYTVVVKDGKLTVLGYTITLYDNNVNGETLNKYNNQIVDVVLSGRTLYSDSWNTLYLPFEDYNIENTVLDGASLKTLADDTDFDSETGTLSLSFSFDLPMIVNNMPFIVKPTNTIENPEFKNATIKLNQNTRVVTEYIDFIGFSSPIELFPNKTNLYLGEGNMLYYPETQLIINSCRAVFELKNGITAGEPLPGEQGIKSFVLNFGDDNEETSIKQINNTESATNTYFTLDGRRLNDKPATPGLYIINGKKVVIK